MVVKLLHSLYLNYTSVMKFTYIIVKAGFYAIMSVYMTGQSINGFAQTLVNKDAEPEKITEGYRFTEGPYWHPDGFLLFSDIPANTIYKWAPGTTEGEVFIKPSGHSNGIAADGEGNLLLAQHDGSISKMISGNVLKPVVEAYKGKRLNSPNDLVAASDGSIYFTDPPFGVDEEDRELDFSGVYRVTPGGELVLLYDGLSHPNGIALSPDESVLYVNDYFSGRILAFDVREDGGVSAPIEFALVGKDNNRGGADGMKVDSRGNLYSTGRGGIYVFSPEGTLLQKIDLPEGATNLGWGGENMNLLFITVPSGVYRLETNTTGDS